MEMVVTQTGSHTAAPADVFKGEPPKGVSMTDAITIRPATYADRTEIERLAALDEGRAAWDEYLLAFEGGDLRAALPIGGGPVLADPFHLTEEIVSLLRFRAGQSRSRSRRIRLRPRAAQAAA
jgi:hypothetical protein